MKNSRDIRMKIKLTPAGAVWKVLLAILYIVMVVFAASYLFAFIWIFINSFKTGHEYLVSEMAIPKEFDFKNYLEVIAKLKFRGYGLWGMLGNTLLLTAWSVFTVITLPNMAGYVLARFDFKLGKIIETVVWMTMVIPVVGAASSTMWFLNATGLYDSFGGMFVLKTAGLGFAAILYLNFYRGVSGTYAEAAYMDGATEWQVFAHVYFPQAKSIILINVVNNFITGWNDYMQPYLYLPSHPTLALGMQQLQSQFVDFGNDYPVMFAGVVMTMIPIIILYLKFSDTIINNMSIGAMK